MPEKKPIKKTTPEVETAVPTDSAEAKKKALSTAISAMNKRYGAGAVMKLGEAASMTVSSISTGSLTLDLALGIGGLPRGRIIEIYGPEASGKTTVALHAVAEVQRNGGTAAFIDAEHALDPVYAKALGVDINSLLVSQPDSGEQALEICEAMVRSGAVDIVVIDSVAALVPQQEIDGEMGSAFVGAHARLMSKALRKLSGAISRTNTVVIFINQLREKVGVMYGNPEVTTGGKALKFYASVRIDIRRIESIKSGKEIIGNHVRAKVVKNKVAPPFKAAEFDIIFGQGISKTGEVINLAIDLEVIERSGSWFSYNGNRLAQGRDAVKKLLTDDPALLSEIETKLRALSDKIDLTAVDAQSGDDDDDESFDIHIAAGDGSFN